jgi:hypothetical protein
MLMASASRWLLASVSSAMALVKTDSNTIEKSPSQASGNRSFNGHKTAS